MITIKFYKGQKFIRKDMSIWMIVGDVKDDNTIPAKVIHNNCSNFKKLFRIGCMCEDSIKVYEPEYKQYWEISNKEYEEFINDKVHICRRIDLDTNKVTNIWMSKVIQ